MPFLMIVFIGMFATLISAWPAAAMDNSDRWEVFTFCKSFDDGLLLGAGKLTTCMHDHGWDWVGPERAGSGSLASSSFDNPAQYIRYPYSSEFCAKYGIERKHCES